MTHQTENKIIKTAKSWSLANIISVIVLALGGIGYLNNMRDAIIKEIHDIDKTQAVIKEKTIENSNKILAIENWKSHLSTFYDKPKGIKIIVSNE